jgi:hypothetical protein
MSAIMTGLVATAVLFGSTALAAAQNETSQKGRDQLSRNVAPHRAQRPDPNAGNYSGDAAQYGNTAQYGWMPPGAGYYNYAPGPGAYYGPGGYFNSDYWNRVWNVAPDFSPGPNPNSGPPFYGNAPHW